MPDSRARAIDAARRRGELSMEQLWLRTVALGGYTGVLELEAYLTGLMPLDEPEQDLLAVAVNERLDELLRQHRVPHRLATPEPQSGDGLHILDRLLTPPAPSAAAGCRTLPPETAVGADGSSETVQRMLRSEPIQPDALAIRARYRPPADAKVGGGWSDAFRTSDAGICLAVGDVAGNDRTGAVGTAAVRDLLRGVAYTVAEPPGAVLSTLDRALRDLAVGALATAVLARIEPADGGRWRLRWSNAGHPPPLLLSGDGTAQLLHTNPADPPLGVQPGTERGDHQHLLPADATVLLYTPGLIEHRRAGNDDGLRWLTTAAGSFAGLPLDELCDTLLTATAATAADDLALLAVRPTALPQR